MAISPDNTIIVRSTIDEWFADESKENLENYLTHLPRSGGLAVELENKLLLLISQNMRGSLSLEEKSYMRILTRSKLLGLRKDHRFKTPKA